MKTVPRDLLLDYRRWVRSGHLIARVGGVRRWWAKPPPGHVDTGLRSSRGSSRARYQERLREDHEQSAW